MRPPGLIVAIDTGAQARAEVLAAAVAPHVACLKLGLEFFAAQGPAGLRGFPPVFLDLKLHDIPNTVAGACAALAPLAPAMVTVHASGGGAMVQAARAALPAATRLLAVTVLTSLGEEDLSAIGWQESVASQAVRLGRLALHAGADGLVCSARELPALRAAFGPAPLLVVPGIRPAGSGAADQRRTATPRQAIEAGADFIVVGRPVTEAAAPGEAAAAIAAEIASCASRSAA